MRVVLRCCVFIAVFTVSVLAVLRSDAQSFSELEGILLEHPSIQQLNFQSQAIREEATAAYALPDPKMSVGVSNVPISSPSFDRFLPSYKSVGVKQSFPSRAGRDARRTRIQAQSGELNALAAARFAELRAELIIQLVELSRIDEQRQLAYQQNSKYEELSEVVKAEIDAGRPAVFRLAEIQARRADTLRTVAELDGEAALINASLIEKIGLVPNTTVPSITTRQWNNDPQRFHAVRVATRASYVADQGIKEAKASWKTNWGVEVTYQQRSSGRGLPDADFPGDDWFSAGVTFSVPVWGKNKQAPNVRAAEARKRSANARTLAATRKSVAQYESMQAHRATAQSSLTALLENISAVEAVIQAQQTQYESGAGDYAPIIDGELVVLTLQMQLATERARALKATVTSNALLVSP
ncbi:MAG: TolC family protein [Gammaproteobacteria bacterium]